MKYLHRNFYILAAICLIAVYHVFSKSDNLVERNISSTNDINQHDNSQQIGNNNVQLATTSEDQDNNINEDNNISTNNSKEIINSVLKINKYDIVLGNKDSNIKIFEYFSYACYHCARYHEKIFPTIKHKFIDTNKIAYITREFITAKQDLDGAMLSRCGGTLMWNKFHTTLLEQQDKWVFNKNYMNWLKDIGKIGGITADQFLNCFKDEILAQQLMLNTVNISKFEIFDGTPCIIAVINDEHIIRIENVITEISDIVEKAANSKDKKNDITEAQEK